jgi:hypothetical protein
MLEQLLTKHSKFIETAYKVVSVYEFNLAGLSPPPGMFKVKIMCTADNQYTCRISHFVHRTGLIGPHRVSFSMHKSEDEALSEAFSHGLMNYDINDDGAKWEPCDWF